MKKYLPRLIRFLELLECDEWTIKVYSISENSDLVEEKYYLEAKKQLALWLKSSQLTGLENYQIGTLILHECSYGCFAVINWWTDNNMLQHYVYLTSNQELLYKNYFSNGLVSCVWELSVLWFERNAWVKHVLSTNEPNFNAYLNEQLNQD